MIVVAGLTPARQQILRFARLQLGEVNRAVEAAWCASGKVLNVGAALASLGAKCRVVCPVGGGARDEFEAELDGLGVAVDWIVTRSPTRVCTTLIDAAAGTVTELVENAAPLTTAELTAYRETYRRAAAEAELAVFTGSLPAETPATFYRELADASPERVIVDARGPELLALLDGPRKPFLAKPNREELAKTVGRELRTDADVHAAMRELVRRGVGWVVVSQGKDCVWAASADGLWRLVPPAVPRVVNPIGCGDCLAAGIAAGLVRRREPLQAIALGMAAAAENLPALLPARLDRGAVERLAATIEAQCVR